MMRRIILLMLVSLLAVSVALDAAPRRRTSRDVKRDKQKTEQEIARTRKRIQDNDRETGRQLDRLQTIEANMALRADTIGNLQQRLDSVNNAIAALNDSIGHLEQRSAALKASYARTARAIRTRRQGMNDMAFIFSARSFAQAWRRMRYLREIAGSAERQARQVEAAQKQLVEARTRLDALKATHSTSLSRLNTAQNALRSEKLAADKLVKNLRAQGKSLSRELDRRRRQAQELQRELDRIIEQEIRAAEERRRKEEAEKARRAEEERRRKEAEEQARIEAERKKNEKPGTQTQKPEQKPAEKPTQKPTQKPEQKPTQKPQEKPAAKPAQPQYASEAEADRRLTGSFESNKGKLLFPVAGRYTIVSNFGTYEHPELSKVKVDNLGIDIEVPAGAKARAVYEGVVSSIFRLDGYHNIVIVRHGQYLTVYAGIDALTVKKGDKVKTGQTLGTVYSNQADDNRTRLHFEIRREKQKLNPAEWVR